MNRKKISKLLVGGALFVSCNSSLEKKDMLPQYYLTQQSLDRLASSRAKKVNDNGFLKKGYKYMKVKYDKFTEYRKRKKKIRDQKKIKEYLLKHTSYAEPIVNIIMKYKGDD